MTEEDLSTMQFLFDFFGKELAHYALVIVTGGDNFDNDFEGSKTFDDFLKEDSQYENSIAHLIQKCHHRYVLLNNKYLTHPKNEDLWENQVLFILLLISFILPAQYFPCRYWIPLFNGYFVHL